MYLEPAITTLTQRISWGIPQEDSFVLVLNSTNLAGTSGRNFQSFHQLVTVENVLAAIGKMNATAEEFNAILSDIRKQAVLEIVPLIIDKNLDSIQSEDYTSMIIENAVLFDDAIGYKVAISVLELFVSTKRSNLTERNAKLAISNLKLELNGFRNDSGYVVAKGLIFYLNDAIKTATNKLFPLKVIIQDGNAW